MSKLNFTIITFSIVFLFSSTTYAQSDSAGVQKSYFKFSLSYLTNSVDYGRKDSLAVPYITPEITYHDKSGFYLAGSLSYLSGIGSQIDAGTITAGYEFNTKNEKLNGDIFGSKYFVSNSSYSVKGEVNAEIGGSLDYNTGPVTINTGVDLAFSAKTDIAINLGLSHAFEFGENESWAITPSALVNIGTQNFYESYFTKRKYSAKRRRRTAQNTTVVTPIIVSKKFAVLDYELSIPVDYAGHRWGLFFTPTFAIPKNGFKYSLNNGTTYQTENLSNSFYAEIGGYIKF